jgi:hypothetical protein
MRKPTLPALPMHQSPRCGARTRPGTPCRQPAVAGKVRCRMHGGTDGIGAPPGNQNALRHGRYTAEAIAQRREVAALLRACREQLGAQQRSGGAGAPQTSQRAPQPQRSAFHAQAPLEDDVPEWAR